MFEKLGHRFFVSALAALTLLMGSFLLTACQKELPSDSEESAIEVDSIEGTERKIESDISAPQEEEVGQKKKDEDQGISLQEAVKNFDRIFILRDGACYSATTAFASGQRGGLLIGGKGEDRVPVLNASKGDLLISTRDNESYAAFPFREEGYAEEKAANILTYDEINGVDPSSLNLSSKQSAAEEILSSKGIAYKDYRWTSSEPTEFVVGGYVGTKWSEDTIEIKNRYYMPDWNAEKIALPVTKTHDGYFVIETESLSQGDYLINTYTSISGVDHMFRLTVL